MKKLIFAILFLHSLTHALTPFAYLHTCARNFMLKQFWPATYEIEKFQIEMSNASLAEKRETYKNHSLKPRIENLFKMAKYREDSARDLSIMVATYNEFLEAIDFVGVPDPETLMARAIMFTAEFEDAIVRAFDRNKPAPELYVNFLTRWQSGEFDLNVTNRKDLRILIHLKQLATSQFYVNQNLLAHGHPHVERYVPGGAFGQTSDNNAMTVPLTLKQEQENRIYFEREKQIRDIWKQIEQRLRDIHIVEPLRDYVARAEQALRQWSTPGGVEAYIALRADWRNRPDQLAGIVTEVNPDELALRIRAMELLGVTYVCKPHVMLFLYGNLAPNPTFEQAWAKVVAAESK